MTTAPVRSSGSSAPTTTAPVDEPPGGWRSAVRKADLRVTPYLFIAPFFVVFGVFGAYPLFYTGWVSLHDWAFGATSGQPFIGVDNYTQLLQDEYFWNALRNTLGIFV